LVRLLQLEEKFPYSLRVSRRRLRGEFLEARIISRRIEHRIEPEQQGRERFGLARVRGMGRS